MLIREPVVSPGVETRERRRVVGRFRTCFSRDVVVLEKLIAKQNVNFFSLYKAFLMLRVDFNISCYYIFTI